VCRYWSCWWCSLVFVLLIPGHLIGAILFSIIKILVDITNEVSRRVALSRIQRPPEECPKAIFNPFLTPKHLIPNQKDCQCIRQFCTIAKRLWKTSCLFGGPPSIKTGILPFKSRSTISGKHQWFQPITFQLPSPWFETIIPICSMKLNREGSIFSRGTNSFDHNFLFYVVLLEASVIISHVTVGRGNSYAFGRIPSSFLL